MTITTQFGEFAVALQYAKYNHGFAKNVRASATVSFTGLPADGNTVVVNGVTYTFKTSLTPTAGQVLIGTTTTITAANLAKAINGELDDAVAAGTTPNLFATSEASANYVFLTALSPSKSVGNALTLTKTGSNITVSGATFSGGITGGEGGNKSFGVATLTDQPSAADNFVVNTETYTFVSGTPAAYASHTVEVKIGATADVTMLNFVNAVMDTGVDGTDYSSGTPANPDAEVIEYSDMRAIMNALVAGTAGNSLVLTKSGTNLHVSGSGTFLGGLAETPFDKASLTWYRLRAREIDYGEMQMQDIIPLEIGGTMTPTGAYKQGVAVGGVIQTMPRIETSIGVLLTAALGLDTLANPASGVYTHTFTFQSNEINIPWIAARRMIPGRDEIFGKGMTGYDNKINSLTTTIAATAPVEMAVSFMGRVPEADNHPEVWSGNSFEDFKSIPLACKGTFRLPTVSGLPTPLPVTRVTVDLTNVVTTPREEMIVGDYNPDDVVPRTRAVVFSAIYKWRDASLFDLLFGNVLKATAWSPTPFESLSEGSDYAVDLLVESPHLITGTSTPYSLRIVANEVVWSMRPIRMRAGDIILMEVTGTVLYNSSGYVKYIVTNGQASAYAAPAEP